MKTITVPERAFNAAFSQAAADVLATGDTQWDLLTPGEREVIRVQRSQAVVALDKLKERLEEQGLS